MLGHCDVMSREQQSRGFPALSAFEVQHVGLQHDMAPPSQLLLYTLCRACGSSGHCCLKHCGRLGRGRLHSFFAQVAEVVDVYLVQGLWQQMVLPLKTLSQAGNGQPAQPPLMSTSAVLAFSAAAISIGACLQHAKQAEASSCSRSATRRLVLHHPGLPVFTEGPAWCRQSRRRSTAAPWSGWAPYWRSGGASTRLQTCRSPCRLTSMTKWGSPQRLWPTGEGLLCEADKVAGSGPRQTASGSFLHLRHAGELQQFAFAGQLFLMGTLT